MGGVRERRGWQMDDRRPAVPCHRREVSALRERNGRPASPRVVTRREGTVLRAETGRPRIRSHCHAVWPPEFAGVVLVGRPGEPPLLRGTASYAPIVRHHAPRQLSSRAPRTPRPNAPPPPPP